MDGDLNDATLVTCREDCGNGLDDDNDGLVDCADPDCRISATINAGTTVCTGGNATFTANPSPAAASVTYRWQSSTNGTTWSNIVGATGRTYTTPALGTSTYFRVVVTRTGATCSGTSAASLVTVVPDPSVSIGANRTSVCVGQNASFSATPAGGVGTRTYQWQSSPDNATWSNIAGATGISYTTPALSSTTFYRVILSQTGANCNAAASNVVMVTVNPPPTITPYSSVNGSPWAIEQNITLCAGGSFRLHPHPLTTTGWVGTGPNGFTSNRRDNDFSNVQPNQSGVYTFTHTDANGCSNTTTYNVTVNSVPDLDQYISVDGGGFQGTNTITVCPGQTIVLDFCCDQNLSFSFRRPDGAVFAGGTNGVANDQILFGANGGNLGTWQATYTRNGCSRTENFTINTVAPSVGGTVSPASQTITTAANGVVPTRHTLGGQTGNIVRWEFQTPNSTVWNNWAGGGSTLAPNNCCFTIVGTWRVRAIVNNGCGEVPSSEGVIVVNEACASVPTPSQHIFVDGNLVNGNTVTVCPGQTVVLDFGGAFGADWNFSFRRPDGASFPGSTNGVDRDQILFGAVGANVGTWEATYTKDGCTRTVPFVVNTIPPSVGGNLSPATGSVCWNNNCPPTPAFTLSGQTGSVVRWEYAPPGGGWTNWGGAGSATAPGGCFSAPGTWRFRAIVNNGCGEVASSEAVWNANQAPTMTPYSSVNGSAWAIEQNITLCAGGSFRLHPHPMTTTGWVGTGPNGFTSNRRDNDFSNVQPNQSGVYTFTHTDANGCSNTTTYNVTVNSVPDLDQYISVDGGGFQNITSTRVCQGQTVVLDFCCDQNLSFSFRRPDGAAFAGGTNGVASDQILFGAVGANLGTWQVTYSRNGCARTENFTVAADAPAVGGTVLPAVQTICANEGIVPTTHALTGQTGSVVRWEFQTPNSTVWNNWDGGGSNTAPNNCCFSLVGTWQVRAIVQNGVCPEQAASAANIVVVADPSVSVSGSTTICSGNTAALTSSVSGGVGTTTYQWQVSSNNSSWTNISGATSANYTTPPLTSTVYYRVIVNQTGSNCTTATSNVATITVNSVPDLDQYISVDGGGFQGTNTITVCPGQSILLDFCCDQSPTFSFRRPDGAVFAGGTNGVANDQILFGANGANVGTWQVTYTRNGCARTENFTINTVAPSVGGTLSPATGTVCGVGSSVTTPQLTLSGQTGNVVRWEWQANNGTWNNWGGAGSTTAPAGWFSVAGTWRFRAIVNNGCGEVASSEAIWQVSTPSVGGIVSPASQTICAGAGFVPTQHTLNGQTGSIVRWEWSNNAGASWNDWGGAGSTTAPNNCCFSTVGTWQVRAIVQSGTCAQVASAVANIIVVADPSVSVAGATTVCSGGTATLTSSVTGGTGTTAFQWQSSTNGTTWVNISGATTQNYNTPALTTTTQYRVVVNQTGTNCDAVTSAAVVVTVASDPVITQQPIDITECIGGTAQFTVSATGGTGSLSYQWESSPNGSTWSSIVGANSATYIPPSSASGSILYRINITQSGSGCDALTSNVVRATIVPDPVPNVTVPLPTAVCIGGAVTLSANITGGVGCSGQWQSSTNGTTWIDIPGATNNTYSTPTLSSNTRYRMRLVCSGSGCCN